MLHPLRDQPGRDIVGDAGVGEQGGDGERGETGEPGRARDELDSQR